MNDLVQYASGTRPTIDIAGNDIVPAVPVETRYSQAVWR